MWYEPTGRRSNIFSSNPFKICWHFLPRIPRINCFSAVTNIYLLGHLSVWSMCSIKQSHGWSSEITVFHNLIEEHISLNVIAFSFAIYKPVCSSKWLKHCFQIKKQNYNFCKQLRQGLLLLFLRLGIKDLNNPPPLFTSYWEKIAITFLNV